MISPTHSHCRLPRPLTTPAISSSSATHPTTASSDGMYLIFAEPTNRISGHASHAIHRPARMKRVHISNGRLRLPSGRVLSRSGALCSGGGLLVGIGLLLVVERDARLLGFHLLLGGHPQSEPHAQ